MPLTTPGAAWRLHVPPSTVVPLADGWQGPLLVPLGAEMPDLLVRKKDGLPTYQLASVADDLRLGTTLVVRGLDLLPSTAAQLWLAAHLSETRAFASPRVQFYHHGLLLGFRWPEAQQNHPGHRRRRHHRHGGRAGRGVRRRGAAARAASGSGRVAGRVAGDMGPAGAG